MRENLLIGGKLLSKSISYCEMILLHLSQHNRYEYGIIFYSYTNSGIFIEREICGKEKRSQKAFRYKINLLFIPTSRHNFTFHLGQHLIVETKPQPINLRLLSTISSLLSNGLRFCYHIIHHKYVWDCQ